MAPRSPKEAAELLHQMTTDARALFNKKQYSSAKKMLESLVTAPEFKLMEELNFSFVDETGERCSRWAKEIIIDIINELGRLGILGERDNPIEKRAREIGIAKIKVRFEALGAG